MSISSMVGTARVFVAAYRWMWAVPRLALGALILPVACVGPDKGIPVGTAAYSIVPVSNAKEASVEYSLGPLDTISIAVMQEPDLSLPSLVVDVSGNVQMPLVGSIHVQGLTVNELSRRLAERLDQYLVRPQVSVQLLTSASQKVTVDGSVEQPGVYAIQGRTTLIDAVAMARGTSRVAALDQIIVFRQIDGRLAAARFNLKDIRMGRRANPAILGNDIIVVGFSNVKGIYRDVVQSASLIASFSYILTR